MPDYENINNPYNGELTRAPDKLDVILGGGNVDSSITQESQSAAQAGGNTAASSSSGIGPAQQASVASGGAMADIVIKNSIQSANWSPKKVGFYIDGQTGYAEFTNVFVSGDIQALTGTIGGWTINATSLSAVSGGNTTILSSGATSFSSGPTGSPTVTITQAGVLTASGAVISGSITATTGQIGGFDIGADYIRDAANSMGLSSTVTGGDDVRGWAGATFANRATAPYRWTEAGAVNASNLTVTGGSITGTLFRTAASGERIEIVTTNVSQIRFYNSSTLYGVLEVDLVGPDGYISLLSDAGGGLVINTGVGASGFSSTSITSAGGSFDTSGNASNGFNIITGKYGGYFQVFGDGTAVDRISTDLELESNWIPSVTLNYDLGSSSKKWSTVYAATISGLSTLTATGTITGNALNNGANLPRIYTGYVVDSASPTITASSGATFTAARPGTGRYTITHNFGSSVYTVQVTALRATGSGAYSAKINDRSTNTFEITVFDDTGAASNSDVMYALMRP